jgi:hypothetical protein
VVLVSNMAILHVDRPTCGLTESVPCPALDERDTATKLHVATSGLVTPKVVLVPVIHTGPAPRALPAMFLGHLDQEVVQVASDVDAPRYRRGRGPC